MRTLLLTGLLLGGPLLTAPAAAQVNVPATPPALPLPPAPDTPAPEPVPVTLPVTPAPAPAPTLKLAALVGANVELVTTTTSRSSLGDVQVSAAPGAKVTKADLEKIRADMQAVANQSASTQTITGKAFFKVAARAADGSVTLLSTVVQNVPGEKQPLTIRITQTVAPGGAVSGLKLESDHPTMKAVLAGLTPDKLEDLADQNGANFSGVYAQPLEVGQPRRVSVTVDTQELLGSVLGAVATPANAQALFGQVKASPLTVTTTTTYQGLNAQGLHEFKQVSEYGDWKVNLANKGNLPAMTVTLLKVNASGTQTYRKDGLPGPSRQSTRQQLQMTMELDGVLLTLTMTQEQTVVMTPK